MCLSMMLVNFLVTSCSTLHSWSTMSDAMFFSNLAVCVKNEIKNVHTSTNQITLGKQIEFFEHLMPI